MLYTLIKSQCAQSTTMLASCQDLLDLYTSDKEKFCCPLVTGDETWIHHWDPESTLESMQWKYIDCLPSKKFIIQPAACKSYDNNFGDSEELRMVDYLPSRCTPLKINPMIFLADLKVYIF